MSQVRQFCCDDETGEVITYEVNEETGEPSLGNQNNPWENRQLGDSIYSDRTPHETKTANTVFPQHGYMCKTKKFQSLKAKILSGSNKISPRMLLLPTLMICPAILCSILSMLEVYLHIRCHKKNKMLNDPNLYYQSPFHIISSMFCGVCRDIDSASKVGHLQDKRRDRYDYFRGIAI